MRNAEILPQYLSDKGSSSIIIYHEETVIKKSCWIGPCGGIFEKAKSRRSSKADLIRGQCHKQIFKWAVAVSQLVELPLLAPEVSGSNPVMSKKII